MALLDKVKKALRITTDAYDDEITVYMDAALADLEVAGVVTVDQTNPLIETAVIIYVKVHFGNQTGADRLKALYDEMKRQLGMATGFTEWSVNDER